MPTQTAHGQLVARRMVFTYWPETAVEPLGLISGAPDGDGRLRIEHVVAFLPGVALPMIRAGLDAMREMGYHTLVAGIPDSFSKARKLRPLLRRVGFTPYATDLGITYWVRHE